jgi:hypothetical protein
MPRRLHRLEIRPYRDTCVHATAFSRAVDTIAIFDECSREDAATKVLAMLDDGSLKLKVVHGHAAYQTTEKTK